MHGWTRFASIVALAVLLAACGGSGGTGGGRLGGSETSCDQPACGRGGTPAPQPTPTAEPDAPAPLLCGGADDAGCPNGYHCVADPTVVCDPATGVACSGLCVLGDNLPSCGGPDGASCPDGYACLDDPTDTCDGGPAADCPGVCRPVAQGECTDDAGCAMLDSRCTVCADGSLSCSAPRCVNGACVLDSRPCAVLPPCGGVASLPCPVGYQCIDEPADDCVPARGDADCAGLCVPETRPPACGGVDGATCPPGLECVEDANDMCDPATGADCPGTCQPPTGGECRSDADCPALPAPCGACADGAAACPRSFCDQGRCNVEFPTCPAPPACTSDTDCGSGQVCLPPDGMCDPVTGAPNCGGICVPDGGGPRPCGGADGATCPDGYVCSGDVRDGCTPDAAGNGCAGVCVPVPPTPAPCRSADDCAAAQLCVACPDGSLSCPPAECVDGACTVKAPSCPPPSGECNADSDCAIAEVCRTCPDGASSCPRPECRNGACTAAYPACPEPGTCGGVAGLTCPPGYTCVDRPGDDCDPSQGAQDCGGICQRQEEPQKCGGMSGETCPAGFECVAAPDGCTPDGAGTGCVGFCRPAPSPACASDADCPAIGAPCRVCADGTTACPRSSCANGQCRFEFPTCADGQDPAAG